MRKISLACSDEFTARFIRSKGHKLIGRAGCTESDHLDLIQEFSLDLIKRCKNFDPKRANWKGFVVVVCSNCYVTILEHRQAEMRSPYREAGSLNRLIKDADRDWTEFGSTISDSQQSWRTGHYPRSREDAWNLKHDVAVVVGQMQPTMRKVCKIVMRDSKATAARELGMSQGSLYEILGRIRARFEKADLRDYLK